MKRRVFCYVWQSFAQKATTLWFASKHWLYGKINEPILNQLRFLSRIRISASEARIQNTAIGEQHHCYNAFRCIINITIFSLTFHFWYFYSYNWRETAKETWVWDFDFSPHIVIAIPIVLNQKKSYFLFYIGFKYNYIFDTFYAILC